MRTQIEAAGPGLEVTPVFVLGMSNNMVGQIARNFRPDAEPIRVHFGPPIDCSEFFALPDQGRTYRAIAERVMEKLQAPAEEDRGMYAMHSAGVAAHPGTSTEGRSQLILETNEPRMNRGGRGGPLRSVTPRVVSGPPRPPRPSRFTLDPDLD